jgi:hypothetical protein
MRAHLLAFVILGLLVSVAPAQQCTTEVAVNVFNARTRDVLHGLFPSDFEARAGHNVLAIASVKPVFRNRVLVLVDAGNHPDRESLATIAELVSEAPPGMPMAFGLFARQAAFTPGFISDNEALGPAVLQVLAQASTLGNRSHTAAALRKALAIFGPHRPGDTILLVTDGAGRQSKSAMSRLHREFRVSGARLQLLMGLSPAITPSGSSEPSQLFGGWSAAERFNDDLIRLANNTGGVLMGFMNSDWLQAASSGYMLSIIMPEGLAKARTWKLRVRDGGNDVPAADLFYPEELTPCTAAMMAALPGKTKPRP